MGGKKRLTGTAQIQMLFLESNLVTYYKNPTFDLVNHFWEIGPKKVTQRGWGWGWGWGPVCAKNVYSCII